MQGDDVFPAELLFADQIPPVLGFDVQTFDRVIGEDVAGVPQSDQMCIIGEDLEGDRVHLFPIIVRGELQLDEVG